ncbi:MAG TPA: nuclear transport factor 2 family protein [Chroococcales cyanobacterium]
MAFKSIVLTLLISTTVLCSAGPAAAETAVQKQIAAVLSSQADAWNKGDLNEFMQAYLHSDRVTFVSGGSKLSGYDALHERYVKRYGDKPETMGKLSVSNLDVQQLGEKSALCIGNWQVERKDQAALSGIFSLVLVKEAGNWKILHDHTSLAEPKPAGT